MLACLRNSGAQVYSILNGKTQKPDGKESIYVGNNNVIIELQLSYEMLTTENILQLKAVGAKEPISIVFISI